MLQLHSELELDPCRSFEAKRVGPCRDLVQWQESSPPDDLMSEWQGNAKCLGHQILVKLGSCYEVSEIGWERLHAASVSRQMTRRY